MGTRIGSGPSRYAGNIERPRGSSYWARRRPRPRRGRQLAFPVEEIKVERDIIRIQFPPSKQSVYPALLPPSFLRK